MLKSRSITVRSRVTLTTYGLASSLIALALLTTACGGSGSGRASIATPVVFENPSAYISTGTRLSGDGTWDGYGEVIDIRGGVLAIGAPEENHSGPGSAYVYRFSGGTWQEEAKLTASDRDVYIKQAKGFEGQRFGSSVAGGEGIIAIGAPGTAYPIAEGYIGAVYLYEYDGQTWVETAKLTPDRLDRKVAQEEVDWLPDRMKRRSFGGLLALDGNTLAVGGDSGTDSVYVFQRAENGWHEQARVPIPGLPGRELYMASLALFGDTLALSALYVPPQPEQSLLLTGSVIVYVFERTGEAWKESLRFVPEGGEVDYLFLPEVNVGASVAVGGVSNQANLLAVGLSGFPDWSRFKDENEVSTSLFGANADIPDLPESKRQTGAVYIFERAEEGGWNPLATLKPAGWENPPGLPSSLYVHPSTADELGNSDAAAFFASAVFPGDLFSEDPEISFFGATVALDGNQLAVTAGFANATYVFERRGQDWVYRFRITPQREKEGVWEDYAQVVAISGDTLLLGTPGEFGNSAYVFDLANTADE